MLDDLENYTFACDKCGGLVKYDPDEFLHVCTKCRTAYIVTEEDWADEDCGEV